ncbi:MAG: class I SAM-dependent methyltransferase [Anaerolineae bacterium]
MADFWIWLDQKRSKGKSYYSSLGARRFAGLRAEFEYNSVVGFTLHLNEIGLDIDVFDGKRVLDGTGRVARWSTTASIQRRFRSMALMCRATDPGPGRPQNSMASPTVNATNGYAESMPYEDERSDLVMMDDVMERVQDPEKTIRECWRVLRPVAKSSCAFRRLG